jgi:hypothetical protein
MHSQIALREQQAILRAARQSERYSLAELIIEAGDAPPGFP